ncbi:MAG: hypothetical protein IKC03_11265, partial [Oscillospiraceae bacterium]|nr:hypothetical protein [Oscillospiraceae bacterium]
EDCTDEEDIVFETRLSAIFSEACEKAGICDQDLVMAAVDGALIIVPETTETEGEIPPGIFRLLQKHKIRPYTFAKVMHDIFEGAQDE